MAAKLTRKTLAGTHARTTRTRYVTPSHNTVTFDLRNADHDYASSTYDLVTSKFDPTSLRSPSLLQVSGSEDMLSPIHEQQQQQSKGGIDTTGRRGSRIPVHSKHLSSNTTRAQRSLVASHQQSQHQHQQHGMVARNVGQRREIRGGGVASRKRQQAPASPPIPTLARKMNQHHTMTANSTVPPSGGARENEGYVERTTTSPPVPAVARRMKNTRPGHSQHSPPATTSSSRTEVNTKQDTALDRTQMSPSTALSSVEGGVTTSPPVPAVRKKHRERTPPMVHGTIQHGYNDGRRTNAVTSHSTVPHLPPIVTATEVQVEVARKHPQPHRQQVLLQELAQLRRVSWGQGLGVVLVCCVDPSSILRY